MRGMGRYGKLLWVEPPPAGRPPPTAGGTDAATAAVPTGTAGAVSMTV